MNVNGVAIATVLSNAVSSVLLLRRLLHGDLVRVELRELRIDRNAFNKIMRIGLPAGIQTASFLAVEHHHPVGHQQPRHGRHGRLECSIQHRDHRLRRA